jgi:hypothetical protein
VLGRRIGRRLSGGWRGFGLICSVDGIGRWREMRIFFLRGRFGVVSLESFCPRLGGRL